MTEKAFTEQFINIVSSTPNTNYGTIAAQFKLLELIQEFYLTNTYTKEEILRLVEKYPYETIVSKAQDHVLGEIISNLNGFYKCRPVTDDFGDDYSQWLFAILNRLYFTNTLFDEYDKEINKGLL
jgi:hypothetical protein